MNSSEHGDGDGLSDPSPSNTAPGGDELNEEIDWVNTDEAARHLGITTRTLYRFIDKGELPAYRFGRVFRLKRNEVEAFIESCRVEPGTLSHLYPDTAPADDHSS